uniref:Uncharacterized protein n=1 Tax=Anguilla anguilla TaxID=7936 RepID=A0A0E9UQP5_ANGAN
MGFYYCWQILRICS